MTSRYSNASLLFGLIFSCILHNRFIVGFAATTTTADRPQSLVPPSPSTTTTNAPSYEVKNVVNKVAVTGATGRMGRYVVQELLDRGVPNVLAIVRDETKFAQLFPERPTNLDCIACDLTNPSAIEKSLQGVDAAIWCATGFSDNPETPWIQRLQNLFGLLIQQAPGVQRQSIDVVGLPALAKVIAKNNADKHSTTLSVDQKLPKVVMCSSAGVTRPTWNDAKKERFRGASDIPIVRLNPFGILDRKRESEQALRTILSNYCIVRPCGLNDDWPVGSRPLLTQGDVAVGRINRRDVASILVDVLSLPEATGKTFEVVGLAGYPKPISLGAALERLHKDGGEGGYNGYTDQSYAQEDILFATYSTMQQLLPGEKQDSAALAMGQTYEQLDKNQIGRFGERGTEKMETVPLKPTEN